MDWHSIIKWILEYYRDSIKSNKYIAVMFINKYEVIYFIKTNWFTLKKKLYLESNADKYNKIIYILLTVR